MSSPLATAFEHHTWATLQLIDACRKLPAEALDTPVPGAFGSLLETLRHYINSDSFYLGIIDGGANRQESARRLGLDGLARHAEATGHGWRAFLQRPDLDPDANQHEVDPRDGYTRDAPLGIRLAQALHHGYEHREQCCLALAALGYQPPDLSGWAFGAATGLVEEVGPG